MCSGLWPSCGPGMTGILVHCKRRLSNAFLQEGCACTIPTYMYLHNTHMYTPTYVYMYIVHACTCAYTCSKFVCV